jgi:hypothetical protein
VPAQLSWHAGFRSVAPEATLPEHKTALQP